MLLEIQDKIYILKLGFWASVFALANPLPSPLYNHLQFKGGLIMPLCTWDYIHELNTIGT